MLFIACDDTVYGCKASSESSVANDTSRMQTSLQCTCLVGSPETPEQKALSRADSPSSKNLLEEFWVHWVVCEVPCSSSIFARFSAKTAALRSSALHNGWRAVQTYFLVDASLCQSAKPSHRAFTSASPQEIIKSWSSRPHGGRAAIVPDPLGRRA